MNRLCHATTGGPSCSAGLAEWDGGAESSDQWQRRADAELYAAKHRILRLPTQSV